MSSRLLFVLLVCCCAAAWGTGLLLPLYTDEITYRMIYSRMLTDGGVLQYLFPTCAAEFKLPPPLLFRPLYRFDALIFGDLSFLYKVRLLGWSLSTVWLLILTALAYRCGSRSPSPGAGTRHAAAVLFLSSAGTMTLLSSMFRPELTIILCITAAAFFSAWTVSGARRRGLPAALVTLAASWISLASHPKAILMQPIFLVCLFVLFKPWKLRLPLFSLVVIMTAAALRFYTLRNSCPEDPALQEWMHTEMLTPSMLLSDPIGTGGELALNVLKTIGFPAKLIFREVYSHEWIPLRGEKPPIDFFTHLSNAAVVLALSVLLLVVFRSWFRAVRRIIACQPLSQFAVLNLGFGAAFLAYTAVESTMLFYEARFTLQLLVVWLVITFLDPAPAASNRAPAGILPLICVSGILNSFNIIRVVLIAYPIWASADSTRYDKYSVPSFSYARVGAQVEEAAKRCGFWPPDRFSSLVLDDWTYPVMSLSRFPLHALYLKYWADAPRLDQYIERENLPGYLLRCMWLEDGWAGTGEGRVVDTGICCRNFREAKDRGTPQSP